MIHCLRSAIALIVVIASCISNTHAQTDVYEVLPIRLLSSIKSQNPIGWNDALLHQNQFGVRLNRGILQIQLNPSVGYYRNSKSPQILPNLKSNELALDYVKHELNLIDAPAKNEHYPKLLMPGESYIRLSSKGLVASIGSESVRWGPGVRHGLILSGNYVGFIHASLSNTKPLRTPIGDFQGHLLVGRLDNSNITTKLPLEIKDSYQPKLSEWRVLTGFDTRFSPTFIKGLTVGFSRSFVGYKSSIDNILDLFPMFSALTKENFVSDENRSGDDAWDQQLSLYFSWHFQESGFRLYSEYGRNDHSMSIRDAILEPEHSRAYVMGAQKGTDIIDLSVEITHLTLSNTIYVRPSPSWYSHSIVRHGITHRGLLIGPEIGPGAKSIWVSLNYKKSNKLHHTFDFERVQRNNDYLIRIRNTELNMLWSDYSISWKLNVRRARYESFYGFRITSSNNYAYNSGYNPIDTSLLLGVKLQMQNQY